MSDILGTQQNFRALSVRDLLQARELYHYHLLNKPNVVGTGIGLYLIRKSDPTPDEERARCRAEGKERVRNRDKGERTLLNSEVREYSWPCVLAFVKTWVDKSQFGVRDGRLQPDDMVPKTLYMPDGRMVPVCVVKVEQGEPDRAQLPEWHWPTGLFGGGMPIIVETQEQSHRATAGCLVTDGHTTYLLTSRHVCGTKGEPVFTLSARGRVQIGTASAIHLSRLEFTEVYPEFSGRRTYVNLDVGLVELADLNDWTSQTFGLGAPSSLADLNELNITTRLIDAPVVATGAASGRLEGRIKALFYRYKSVGGFDYVADFLIAPRQPDGNNEEEMAQTQPGDSGAIWHLITKQKRTRDDEGWCEDDDFEGDLRPLSIEWGGQVFVDRGSGRTFTFGLSTSLTTVCKHLDVELVLGQNTGVLPYWGQMGHYSIGSFACNALPAGKLKTFMTDNVDQISFAIGGLVPKEISKLIKHAKENDGLIPLADVPDLVWKNHRDRVVGGRDTRWAGFRPTGPEHPVHYADIDEVGPNGKTLMEISLEDDDNISVGVWQQFYDAMGHTQQRERGLLPFRVWQFYDDMRRFAANGEADKFLCAAGLLSHYIGDACQPLHGSIYADGYSDIPTIEVHHRQGTGEEYTTESHLGAGIHSTYETKMVDRHATEIVDGIEVAISGAAPALPQIDSGKDAAKATLELMARSAQRIPPKELVDKFIEEGAKTTVAVQDALWETYGTGTIEVMADGARVLARVWEGAWAQGNGNAIPNDQLGVIDPELLKQYYRDQTFVESVDLDNISPLLT